MNSTTYEEAISNSTVFKQLVDTLQDFGRLPIARIEEAASECHEAIKACVSQLRLRENGLHTLQRKLATVVSGGAFAGNVARGSRGQGIYFGAENANITAFGAVGCNNVAECR